MLHPFTPKTLGLGALQLINSTKLRAGLAGFGCVSRRIERIDIFFGEGAGFGRVMPLRIAKIDKIDKITRGRIEVGQDHHN